jgi:hypothetical protein
VPSSTITSRRRTLSCFAKLARFDVTVFNHHVEDSEVLADA